jgi:hypothetical protein
MPVVLYWLQRAGIGVGGGWVLGLRSVVEVVVTVCFAGLSVDPVSAG